jgi:hypothetical protein
MSDEANPSNNADAGRGLSEELGLLPQPAMLRGVDEDYYTAEQMRAYGAQERAAERERCSTLPRLPTPRLLASGTIAGKRIELHGWHTEDIEIWQRQHGLKFGA